MIWASLLELEQSIGWNRSRVFILGEAGVGKTSLLRALLNMPYEEVLSTIGADISTLDATDTHEWREMTGTEYEQVKLCVRGSTVVMRCFGWLMDV